MGLNLFNTLERADIFSKPYDDLLDLSPNRNGILTMPQIEWWLLKYEN